MENGSLYTPPATRANCVYLCNGFAFDDPKTFTKPWSAQVKFNLLPDTDLLEFHCDNEKWTERSR